MFFILSKLLHIFTTPFFWIVVAWLFFAWKRKSKWRKKSLYLALFCSFFFTNTFIFKEFVRLWEVPGSRIETMPKYDVAVVLGGMFEYNSGLEVLSIRRGGDRIWQTLSLYHRGVVKKILISGDSGYVTDRGLKEAQRLRDELVVWGIPAADIMIDSVSKNTYQNAVESVKILKAIGLNKKSILLVTSSTHMKRSLACFEKQGLKVTPFSTDLYTGKKRSYHWDEFIIPSLSTANDWSRLSHEWVGYVMYKMMGYC
jgi:uncharacterized SAM-binding protein YcdF (DUF218 family)